jgi:hypothetical protein
MLDLLLEVHQGQIGALQALIRPSTTSSRRLNSATRADADPRPTRTEAPSLSVSGPAML